MQGPNDDLRDRIAEELLALPPADARGSNEEAIAEVLFAMIAAAAASDVDGDSDGIGRLGHVAAQDGTPSAADLGAAEAMLVVVHEWASLISYVSSAIYGPASPMPRRLIGWGKKAITQIQTAANVLLRPLAAAARVTGASSWSISVGFPWGISVGLTWL
ncbi:MAG TPA: hypothetical protein VKU92_11205 [Acidimicrobiales bacterium]|nr:hypothetical protein [Acidimicrobiales bacterium]